MTDEPTISGYYTGDFTITALCEQADQQLFRALKYNPIQSLHRLLPPELSTPYLTDCRVHTGWAKTGTPILYVAYT